MKEGTDNKGNGKNVVPFAKPERKAKPRRPMTLKEALMASLNTDEENQAEYFDECYARVLRIQARIIDNSREPACDEQENRLGKLQDRESAALWDVIHARGIHRWQIAHKLELLEELLHTGQNWFDQREFFLLNSARIDLQHADWRPKALETLGSSPQKEGA